MPSMPALESQLNSVVRHDQSGKRPKKDWRRKPHRDHGSNNSKQPVKRKKNSHADWDPTHKGTASRQAAKLDSVRFLSLPAEALSRICRFLLPSDLLSLARTNKGLRSWLLQDASKPHWNATRYLSEMPECTVIPFSEVSAFVYDKNCQVAGCNASTHVWAVDLCRRYCTRCASANLLSIEEAKAMFPAIPQTLLRALPWTPRRLPPDVPNSGEGQFYSRSDVAKLDQRLRTLKPLDQHAQAGLQLELSSERKRKRHLTSEIFTWYSRELRKQQIRRNERWPVIAEVLRVRWGWKPVEQDKLPRKLKKIVDRLLDVTELNEEVWTNVQRDLKAAINKSGQPIEHSARPFSLRQIDSAT